MKNSTSWQKALFEEPSLQGKIVAIKNNKIRYVGNSYSEILQKLKVASDYSFYKVPSNLEEIRILSLKLKQFRTHLWLPLHPVTFHLDNGDLQIEEMLVDSGADISIINYEFGLLLGFEKSPHEVLLEAEGIGGVVPYLLRSTTIEIENFRFENRFAWMQDTEVSDMIIGREIVFDLFDIEFKQADEEIYFRKRA